MVFFTLGEQPHLLRATEGFVDNLCHFETHLGSLEECFTRRLLIPGTVVFLVFDFFESYSQHVV